MGNRAMFCATCGVPRGSLEQRRESWSLGSRVIMVPRKETGGKPWQQFNDLIINAAVWRNGGTSEECHLCDECLRVGLRAIKLAVNEALEIVDRDRDKDAELARLTQEVGVMQVKHSNELHKASLRIRALEKALQYAAECSTLEMVRDAARGMGVLDQATPNGDEYP